MDGYLDSSVIVAFLIISAALQGQSANLRRHITRNDQNNRDIHPSTSNKVSSNLNNFDSVCRQHASQFLSDELLNMTCASMNKWIIGSQTNKEMPAKKDIMQMEKDLYKSMGRHYPSVEDTTPPKARKEYRMLSDEERERFHDAINTLKSHPVGDSNYYDCLTNFHLPHVSPSAHSGAAFLGWHKQYLLRMEYALQAVDPSVTLPYWDSTLDSHLPHQESDSIMWTDAFMGNKAGLVVTGPFANWTMPRPIFESYNLIRGTNNFSPIMTDADYDYVMNIDDFRGLTVFVDWFFEAIHGNAHGWVGGAMQNVANSPNDPAFFMHHAFIDLMWDAQREIVYKNGGRDAYHYPSVDDDEAFAVGSLYEFAEDSPHYPLKRLLPFEILNKESVDDKYMTSYFYEGRPKCSASNPDCGSPYLFCIDGIYKCAPKLREQARCVNFKMSDSCYEGECVNGYCQQKPN